MKTTATSSHQRRAARNQSAAPGPKGSAKPKRRAASTQSLRFKRLLVPIDFSDASKQALQYASSLAQTFGAVIDLIYVEPTALPPDLTNLPIIMAHEQNKCQARTYLAQFSQPLLPAAFRGQLLVQTGSPYFEITQMARQRRTDLIVIATHGHTGVKHLLMGSTAERVLRHAHCPVLTVPVGKGRKAAPPKPRFRKLLVPTDFSPASEKAFGYAAALAKRFRAKISLLNAIEAPLYPRFGYAHIPIEERRLARSAQERLQALRQSIGAGLVTSTQAKLGTAYLEIAQEATRQNSDLIVIATHGRTGLTHALLGSTAERVARYSSCPVLIVRKIERDFVKPASPKNRSKNRD